MSETTIPLSKMIPWRGNVRKTGAADGIEELAASIAAHGLLQSLVVRKASRGRYAVVAGRRRHAALSQLAEAGRLDASYGVPCRVLDAGTDATEISLAENVVRAPMHPADQFEAFRRLVDNGASCAEIASRFGVTETLVTQRMRLGRVSPALLNLYRSGVMSLDQVKALAVSDDQAAQQRVWRELPDYGRHPSSIRQALTEGEVPATDKRVRLVTLAAYEAAGGTVRRDLFDERNAGYVLDPALLDRLVQAALAEAAESLAREGWLWVEVFPDFDWHARERFRQVRPRPVPLSDEDAAELDALTEESDALREQGEGGEDDLPAEAAARLSVVTARLDQLTDRLEVFGDDALAIGGAVISLRHDGSVQVDRGLVRPEDMPGKAVTADKTGKDPAVRAALPSSLIEELTQHRTAALQAEFALHPDVALAAVVHALTLEAFYGHEARSCLEIRLGAPRLGPAAEGAAAAALAGLREGWAERLPGEAAGLWDWCLDQTRPSLLDLLAVVTAHAVNAVRPKGTGIDGRTGHSDSLAASLHLDMTGWYEPTAEAFFSRVPKAQLLEALADMRGQPNPFSWPKLKKAELAVLAERTVPGTGWLPEPLRSSPVAADDTASGTGQAD